MDADWLPPHSVLKAHILECALRPAYPNERVRPYMDTDWLPPHSVLKKHIPGLRDAPSVRQPAGGPLHGHRLAATKERAPIPHPELGDVKQRAKTTRPELGDAQAYSIELEKHCIVDWMPPTSVLKTHILDWTLRNSVLNKHTS